MGTSYSTPDIEEVDNTVKQNRYLLLKQIKESDIKLKKTKKNKKKLVFLKFGINNIHILLLLLLLFLSFF